MNRRTFLFAATAGMVGLHADAAGALMPIIDTHIHLYDPTRPQGVPWPPKNDAVLYKPALPGRYRRLTKALGIVGAIEVECSPWLEDNQWVLDIAARDPIIVGTVGDLEPGKADFRKQLARFHRNPLFRGIRYGNLWNRNFRAQLSSPTFISDCKALADAGLEMDSAQPDPALVEDLVRFTDLVPNLRVVLDHLPQVEIPTESQARKVYESNLRKLGERRQVYVKVSEVLRRVGGQVPVDMKFYKPRLDELWEIFGEDRLIFGSDWPNSEHWGTYPQVLSIVREYFTGKGQAAMEKFFWKNSLAAYRWVTRQPDQPSAVSFQRSAFPSLLS